MTPQKPGDPGYQPKIVHGTPNRYYVERGPEAAIPTGTDRKASQPMSDISDHDLPPTHSDHYSFTGETMTTKSGSILYQIEAAVNQPNAGVSAGDIGGWVSADAKLLDKAWLSPDTRLEDSAVLAGRARLGDTATMGGNAKADADSFIAGRARVDGAAHVTDYARVGGDARVTDNASLSGESSVRGSGVACGDVKLVDKASIIDEAKAFGGTLSGNFILNGTSEHHSGDVGDEVEEEAPAPQTGLTYGEIRKQQAQQETVPKEKLSGLVRKIFKN